MALDLVWGSKEQKKACGYYGYGGRQSGKGGSSSESPAPCNLYMSAWNGSSHRRVHFRLLASFYHWKAINIVMREMRWGFY